MNAVVQLTGLLAPPALRRLAALRVNRFEAGALDRISAAPRARRELDTDAARAHVVDRWAGDLCGLLNAMSRGELGELATAARVDALDALGPTARSPTLRAALWDHGARLERNGVDVPAALQPRPVVLGGHLVVQAAPRGMFPPALAWPRPLPAAAHAAQPDDEPDVLDDLLAAADRAIGVRLGRRGRDKGAWGSRAAALLGVIERGADEPDWRGDVEVKTVPVALDRDACLWRVVEDPAIAMHGTNGEAGDGAPNTAGRAALAKLQRTLWLCRADLDGGDATIVSWYLLDWDPEVARLARRYLHVRPKGPAGTDARGLYLHKRFFADAGLLASLNGWTA